MKIKALLTILFVTLISIFMFTQNNSFSLLVDCRIDKTSHSEVSVLPGEDEEDWDDDDDAESWDDDDEEDLDDDELENESSFLLEANKYMASGLYEEAVPMYQKAIEEYPTDDNAYVALARCYYFLENYPKSIFLYKKAIKLNYQNPKAFEGLARIYLYTTQYRNYTKALQYAKQANYLSHGDDCQILDILAESYFYNGEYKSALTFIRKASNLCSYDNLILEHLKKYERAARQ